MERGKEFIDNAKSEQLTNEEMAAVAGGAIRWEISGRQRDESERHHYTADPFMLNQMKKESEASNLKKIEALWRSAGL